MRPKIGVLIYANPDEYPSTINTIEILAERGYEVTVIARNQNNPQRLYPNRVTVYRLGPQGGARFNERKSIAEKIKEFVSYVYDARKLAAACHCDLLIAYDMYGFLAASVAATRHSRHRPVIYHNHDLAETSVKTSLGYWVKQFELRYARFAIAVVFPESNRARLFRDGAHLDRDPLIIPNYPRRSAHPANAALRRELTARGLQFKYMVVRAGAICDEQCIPQAVDALESLPPEYICVFFGVGADSYIERVKVRARELGVANRAVFLPYVPYDKCIEYMSSADVGLATYLGNDINYRYLATAGNKLFLYAMCGVPAVVSKTRDFQQITERYGLGVSVNPESPQELAEAIRYLTQADVHERFSTQARRAHLSDLNYDTAIQPLLAVVDQALS